MAFTKVSLTGTIDTIKGAFTAVNNLIDDLLSTSSGKGASQIGIEDSAGNVSADNVEDAIAEIYSDHSSGRTLAEVFDENPDTTTGLTWGYKSGVLRSDNTITTVSAGTISLTDDATNYVEVDTAGTVSKNTTSFTSAKMPIRQVVCVSGVQTTSTDKRAWFIIGTNPATTSVAGVVELATDAEAVAGTDTERAVTPANLTEKMAAPGAIGGTTPAAVSGTSITATTAIVTNTINERTASAGITIDGMLIKDGKVVDGSINQAAIGAAAVGQGELKTSSGSVSVNNAAANLTLPGGEYGFYPQLKMNHTAFLASPAAIMSGSYTGVPTYVTNIYLSSTSGGGWIFYAQQTYVAASGEAHWIFILRDKATKDIISVWQCPDHPCMGNGGKPEIVPHPFPCFDPVIHEIIVINPTKEEVLEILDKTITESETEPDRDFLEVFLEEYEIDDSKQPAYPTIPVTVGLPKNRDWKREPDGTKVKPIKKVITKPKMVRTAKLSKKK